MRSALILDDHAGFRKLLRLHLNSKWPEARVVESDPASEGCTPDDYDGAGHDLILLDYQLGTLNGFDFLRRFKTLPHCPPVLMLTGEGNERLAVEAIKLGAADYIPKQQMTHEVLIRAVQEVMDARGTVERQQQAVAAPILVPERQVRIDGLNLLRKIAEGGMSTVFLCDSGSGTQVLKIIDLNAKDETMQRFSRESEILRSLRHRNIVQIFDQGFTREYAYITMEFMEKGTLQQVSRTGLDPEKAVEYALHIADALEVVHQAGIVHRDIKPQNVMFRSDDSLALIDFGLAKSFEENSDLTRFGQILGTPHYISPEQIEGLSPDARSDLYSLGIIFYELLTGCVPYAARTPLAVMYKHKHAPIPQLPAPLDRFQPIIDLSLAKNPSDRFASAAELRESLIALA